MCLFYLMAPAIACESMGWWLSATPLWIATLAVLLAIERHNWLEMKARWEKDDELMTITFK